MKYHINSAESGDNIEVFDTLSEAVGYVKKSHREYLDEDGAILPLEIKNDLERIMYTDIRNSERKLDELQACDFDNSYVITLSVNPYHAHLYYHDEVPLRIDGNTIVEWIVDDNHGLGYTLKEARDILHGYYREDKNAGDKTVRHNYLELSYESDVKLYRAVKVKDLETL